MDLREHAARTTPVNRHPWELARLDVLAAFLKTALQDTTSGLILDVGCGDAFVIRALAARFPAHTFIGVDIAFEPDFLARLRSETTGQNLHFFTELKETAAFLGDRKANAIMLGDVIEHIEDDIAFLNLLRAQPFTHTQTRTIITVPAFQALFGTHDVFLGHYRRYTRKMLVRHAAESGWTAEKSGYFFTSLLLPRLAQVLIEKTQSSPKPSTGSVEWQGGTITSGVIAGVLRLDFWIGYVLSWIGIRIWGLSTYAICRASAS